MRRNILLNLIVATSKEQKMNATSKAREDIEELLKNEGVEVISISYKATSNIFLENFASIEFCLNT